MPLKSMKIEKKDRKKMENSIINDTPRYPFGLNISLGDESLEKLGMDTLPSVGDTMTLIATVNVDSTGEHESSGGKKHRNVSLQITEMALEEKIKDDTLEKLYG